MNKQNPSPAITPARRKRINRLKKLILRAVLLMILLPTTGCIVLGVRVFQLSRSLRKMSSEVEGLEQALQASLDATNRAESLLEINDEIWRGAEAENETEVIQASEGPEEEEVLAEEPVKVYLTFDDGPSIYTDDILDILAEYDVKATFFVTGKEGYGDAYRRIVEEGHTLGMHSYSHNYSRIYASLGDFQQDMERLRDFLYEETGTISKFYRFPGGSSNHVSSVDMQELIAYLDAMEITYFDWNISAGDASSIGISKEQIVNRIVPQVSGYHTAVILMHDSGDKYSTVEALPLVIEKIQELEEPTEFLPITEETMLVQHVQKEE